MGRNNYFGSHKHFSLTDIREGSIIRYNSGGGTRTVKVNFVDEDIKNGQPGFDGNLATRGTTKAGKPCWKINNDECRWGYLDQITAIVRF